MAAERVKQLVLALLVVALGAVIWYRVLPATDAAQPPAAGATSATRPGRGQAPITAPDVHMDALNAERPTPGGVDRNLFRFKPKPPPPSQAPRPVAPPVQSAPAPSGPPPIPPIPLKYIGYIQSANGEKIASFTDATSQSPVLAKEGGIVLGRYKLWRIGGESVEVSYVDGSGRQTIRQTGQ